MGLMNRVLDTRERSTGYSATSSTPSESTPLQTAPRQAPSNHPEGFRGSSRLQEILDELGQGKWGVGTPGMVFQCLCEGLGIQAGALLIRDNCDNAFRPWAQVGLDPTTISRLTMTRGQLNALCPGFLEAYRADNRTPLLPFLSFRQGTALEYALLVRLRYRGRVAGMLLILESEVFQMEPESREILLAALSEPVAREIIEERDTIFDRIYSPLILEKTDFRRSVRNISEDLDHTTQALVMLQVELTPMEKAFTEINPTAHPRRSAEDIRSVTAALLGGTGDLCVPKQGTLVCASLVPAAENGEMLIGELVNQLQRFFPAIPATHVPPYKTWIFPTEHTSPDAILEEVFTDS